MVICRAAKPNARKWAIVLINAVYEVTRERAQRFLTEARIGWFASGAAEVAEHVPRTV